MLMNSFSLRLILSLVLSLQASVAFAEPDKAESTSYVRISFSATAPIPPSPNQQITYIDDPAHLIDGRYVYIQEGNILSPKNIAGNDDSATESGRIRRQLEPIKEFLKVIHSANPKDVASLYKDPESLLVVQSYLAKPDVYAAMLKSWAEVRFYAPALIYQCKPKRWVVFGFTSQEDLDAPNSGSDAKMLLPFNLIEDDRGNFTLGAGDTCDCTSHRNIISALSGLGYRGIDMRNVSGN